MSDALKESEDDLAFCIRWLGAPLCAVIAGVKSTRELREQKPHPERFAYTREVLNRFAERGEVYDWARAWFMGTQIVEFRHPFGGDVEDNPLLMIAAGRDNAERRFLVGAAGSHIYG